jgi:hypothetical protein
MDTETFETLFDSINKLIEDSGITRNDELTLLDSLLADRLIDHTECNQ